MEIPAGVVRCVVRKGNGRRGRQRNGALDGSPEVCFCDAIPLLRYLTLASATYLERMTRAEDRPEEGDLQDPGGHPAESDHCDDQADLQEEHQLQRPPPLHLLPLLYLQLHTARVPAYRVVVRYGCIGLFDN